MNQPHVPGKFYEDWELGDVYETAATTVTEAHLLKFAYLTGYYNPLNMDAEYAKSSIFGERVAPGLLVHSISTGQVNQTRLFEGTTVAFLGVRYLKFVRPVKIGDTIKTLGKLIKKRETKKPGRAIVIFKTKVVNQKGEPVAVSERAILVRMRSEN